LLQVRILSFPFFSLYFCTWSHQIMAWPFNLVHTNFTFFSSVIGFHSKIKSVAFNQSIKSSGLRLHAYYETSILIPSFLPSRVLIILSLKVMCSNCSYSCYMCWSTSPWSVSSSNTSLFIIIWLANTFVRSTTCLGGFSYLYASEQGTLLFLFLSHPSSCFDTRWCSQ